MARYQVDDEPMIFQPYTPGVVTLTRFWFVTLCALAFIGAAFILMILVGV